MAASDGRISPNEEAQIGIEGESRLGGEFGDGRPAMMPSDAAYFQGELVRLQRRTAQICCFSRELVSSRSSRFFGEFENRLQQIVAAMSLVLQRKYYE